MANPKLISEPLGCCLIRQLECSGTGLLWPDPKLVRALTGPGGGGQEQTKRCLEIQLGRIGRNRAGNKSTVLVCPLAEACHRLTPFAYLGFLSGLRSPGAVCPRRGIVPRKTQNLGHPSKKLGGGEARHLFERFPSPPVPPRPPTRRSRPQRMVLSDGRQDTAPAAARVLPGSGGRLFIVFAWVRRRRGPGSGGRRASAWRPEGPPHPRKTNRKSTPGFQPDPQFVGQFSANVQQSLAPKPL